MTSRVFVVDYELLSSLGVGKEAHLKSLRDGFSGASFIRNFPVDALPNTAGAEVKDNLSELLHLESPSVKEAARYDRKLELLLACKGLVQKRWSSYLNQIPPDRVTLSLGLGLDICPVEAMSSERASCRYPDWSRFFNRSGQTPNLLGNPIDTAVQSWRSLLGSDSQLQANNILTACASSAQALGMAFRSIRRNERDLAVVGGGDSLLNLLGYISFLKMGVIPPSTEEASQQCKPLDALRGGTLLGEGASLFLLMSESLVKKLGLTPKIEFLGYGSSLDAFKITAPDPEGVGMKLAMKRALKDAALPNNKIEYLNLHGTGTKANDPAEVEAVSHVFEGRALPVSSTKDRHGHLIAGAGALELGLTCLGLEHQFMAGTLNLQKPIDNKGLEFLRAPVENRNYKIAMSNSFAFGGVNASLIVGRI